MTTRKEQLIHDKAYMNRIMERHTATRSQKPVDPRLRENRKKIDDLEFDKRLKDDDPLGE